jgi:hypothetical protein
VGVHQKLRLVFFFGLSLLRLSLLFPAAVNRTKSEDRAARSQRAFRRSRSHCATPSHPLQGSAHEFPASHCSCKTQ